MTEKLSFTILGEPVAKGRARASARVVNTAAGPRAIVTMHTPKATVAAEKAIRDEFKRRWPDHKPWTGPVMLRFTAVFETPKSFNKALQIAAAAGKLYHIAKPDADNCAKLVADALNGIAWHDDSQLQGGGVKRYGSPARIDVTIEHLTDHDAPPTPREAKRRALSAQPQFTLARPAKKAPKRRKYPPALQARIDAALACPDKDG